MVNAKDRPLDGSRSQNPSASYHISWADLQRIERAMLPLMILSGGDESERDPQPPQALIRANLRNLWAALQALARRMGGAHG